MGRKAPPFLWGQKKIKRSDGDAWLSRATPPSTSPGLDHPGHRTSRQPGLPQEQASEGVGRYKVCTSSGALRSTAPPNDHPIPQGQGQRKEESYVLRLTLRVQFEWFPFDFPDLKQDKFPAISWAIKKKMAAKQRKKLGCERGGRGRDRGE